MDLSNSQVATPFPPYHDDGENPSEATSNGFLWVRRPDFYSDKSSGKWCVVRPLADINALWATVRAAVLAGRFPAALVSSPAQAALHGGTYVICLFTLDWTDAHQVMTARDFLREIGVTEEIGYKRDIDTMHNIYGGPDEFVYRA
jgi:hypothetical protein